MGYRFYFSLAIISFLIGTAWGSLVGTSSLINVNIYTLISIILIITIVLIKISKPWQITIILLIFGIGSGLWYGERAFEIKKSELIRVRSLGGEKYYYFGRVEKLLYKNERTSTYLFRILERQKPDTFDNFDMIGKMSMVTNTGSYSSLGTIFLSIPSNLTLQNGDHIRILGSLKHTITFPLSGFERYGFMQGGHALLNAYTFDRVETNKKSIFSKARIYWQNLFEKHFPREVAAILLGMTIGVIELFEDSTKDAFINSGLTHILVVSGSNIAFLILFISFFLKYIHIQKIYERFIIITIILLYGSMVGWDMTVLRASIMGILSYIAISTGRSAASISLLLLTCLILTLIFPLALVYDAGFGLSFAATLGILLYHRDISQGLLRYNIPKWIHPIFSVPIAASIGSLPVLLYHFNTLSIVSLISNILVASLLGFTLFSAVIFGIIASFSSFLGYVFGYIVYIPSKIILMINSLFGNIAMISVDSSIATIVSVFLLGFFTYTILERSIIKKLEK